MVFRLLAMLAALVVGTTFAATTASDKKLPDKKDLKKDDKKEKEKELDNATKILGLWQLKSDQAKMIFEFAKEGKLIMTVKVKLGDKKAPPDKAPPDKTAPPDKDKAPDKEKAPDKKAPVPEAIALAEGTYSIKDDKIAVMLVVAGKKREHFLYIKKLTEKALVTDDLKGAKQEFSRVGYDIIRIIAGGWELANSEPPGPKGQKKSFEFSTDGRFKGKIETPPDKDKTEIKEDFNGFFIVKGEKLHLWINIGKDRKDKDAKDKDSKDPMDKDPKEPPTKVVREVERIVILLKLTEKELVIEDASGVKETYQRIEKEKEKEKEKDKK